MLGYSTRAAAALTCYVLSSTAHSCVGLMTTLKTPVESGGFHGYEAVNPSTIQSTRKLQQERYGTSRIKLCMARDASPGGSPRRRFLANGGAAITAGINVATGFPSAARASTKSRSDGYAVQKTTEEWKSMLTPRQFDILRNGGTERPYSSVLEGEEREGTFFCAGCGTALFDSREKFHSGTGWPSFATALDGVEIEKINVFEANMRGAELRCKTCGGHLGDVFTDGWIFVGTRAAESGKRFCIDGAALIFHPSGGEGDVVGDQVPKGRQG